jgi:flagellar basal-body rod modification protein FlgD
MTTAISGQSSAADAATLATATKQNDALSRDAFLKLLVAQLSNQDPLQPMQGTEFVTQLAQFSAVEQAVSQTSKLDMLSAQLSGIAANEAVSLIGKQVTVRGQALTYDGVSAANATINLGGAASEVKVSITGPNGEVIRTINLGASPAGPLSIAWDGRDDAGQPVAPGSYSFEVSAKGANGSSVSVTKDVTGVVTEVSFEKGYPTVKLDSGVTASIADLVSAGSAPQKP